MTTLACGRDLNHSRFRHSSRNLPLKPSSACSALARGDERCTISFLVSHHHPPACRPSTPMKTLMPQQFLVDRLDGFEVGVYAEVERPSKRPSLARRACPRALRCRSSMDRYWASPETMMPPPRGTGSEAISLVHEAGLRCPDHRSGARACPQRLDGCTAMCGAPISAMRPSMMSRSLSNAGPRSRACR